MPEEDDVEDYLERIRRRWDSSLLTEEQNQERWNRWIGNNETSSE